MNFARHVFCICIVHFQTKVNNVRNNKIKEVNKHFLFLKVLKLKIPQNIDTEFPVRLEHRNIIYIECSLELIHISSAKTVAP
jgi:hypothetical protein